MSFSINWQIALIFLAILPVLAGALFLVMFKAVPLFNRIFKKYDALNNSVQEDISGIRVVKSFVREDYEKEKFDRTATQVKNDFTKAEKLIAINNPVMMFCIYAAILLVSFFGAKMIILSVGSSLTTGQLSSLINYGVQILSSMMMLSMVLVMVSMADESSKRITQVLTRTPSIGGGEGGKTKVNEGSIEYKNVSFKYDLSAPKYALKNVNLQIRSGETVGILGGTGAAKSSLIQLLPRLYETTEGEVLVGGVNVRDYEIDALRAGVAVVLQKNVLFSGTIKENLRWGDKNATDEEMARACRIAQAEEFISQLPKQYDTYIEQGGANVSGGQKQRLCIARALLKKPRILIFDDSTSAVDTKTDAKIRKALREEIPDTTKIIIAQRVSSVSDADKILVMDGGEIVESGTHDELIARGGIYRQIYDSQTKAIGEDIQ